METEATVILLFIVATTLVIAVRRLAVPYTVAPLFAGLALQLFNGFEAPHLTKTLLFSLFLPGLPSRPYFTLSLNNSGEIASPFLGLQYLA